MKQLVISNREFKGMVNTLCRDIANSGWRPDYVVGITRGGLTPAAMISHYFGVPCETLKVSLRDGGESESNLWMAEQAFGYVPKDERGSDWPSSCLPKHPAWSAIWNRNVRFAVLVNNQASNYKDIDYAARHINKLDDPCWVVFPWENWWSN